MHICWISPVPCGNSSCQTLRIMAWNLCASSSQISRGLMAKHNMKIQGAAFPQICRHCEAQLRQQTDLIQAQTEAQKTIIASQAIAQKRMQEGYTYQQERSFDVAQDAAKNEGAGGLTGLGIGIGCDGRCRRQCWRSGWKRGPRCAAQHSAAPEAIVFCETAARSSRRTQHSAITADTLSLAIKISVPNVDIDLQEPESSAQNAVRRGRNKRCEQGNGLLSSWYF